MKQNQRHPRNLDSLPRRSLGISKRAWRCCAAGVTIVNDPKEKQSSPTSGGVTIIGAANGPDDSSGQPPQTPTEPSNDETDGGCIAIIGIHAPESESSRRERRIAGFFILNLKWIAEKANDGGGDCNIVFNERDDQGGAEGDQPPKRDDARPKRFVQFAFSSKGFYMELPDSILTATEAEVILRERPQFFFASTHERSDDPNAFVNQFNPLRREYANGEERLAAEDMAYVFFDVWKLPVSVPLDVKAGRF